MLPFSKLNIQKGHLEQHLNNITWYATDNANFDLYNNIV